MQTIFIPATDRSPELSFDFANLTFSIRGESYPEDAAAFYGPVLGALERFLQTRGDAVITVDIALIYFNSSSAKALMNLLLLLEAAAAAGNAVTVNWHYAEDDDTMQEFGEEFAEDVARVTFNLKTITAR